MDITVLGQIEPQQGDPCADGRGMLMRTGFGSKLSCIIPNELKTPEETARMQPDPLATIPGMYQPAVIQASRSIQDSFAPAPAQGDPCADGRGMMVKKPFSSTFMCIIPNELKTAEELARMEAVPDPFGASAGSAASPNRVLIPMAAGFLALVLFLKG